MSRKSEILDLLVAELKLIDGTFDLRPGLTYRYLTNVYSNVFRKFKYLDEINDFPSITFSAGTEYYTLIGAGQRFGALPIKIRGYVFSDVDTCIEAAENLAQDIEHVINNIREADNARNLGIEDGRVLSIVTDEGLLAPYGCCDLSCSILYRQTDC